jgi:hypothetical protein
LLARDNYAANVIMLVMTDVELQMLHVDTDTGNSGNDLERCDGSVIRRTFWRTNPKKFYRQCVPRRENDQLPGAIKIRWIKTSRYLEYEARQSLQRTSQR